MEEKREVLIKNNVSRRVGIHDAELKVKRVWEKKGAVKPIPFEDLKQLIYNPGVEYMFTQGILTIDDMEVKIALGLEPEGAKEPENIIVLTDVQMKRMLTVAPLHELKELVAKLPYEQLMLMTDYAIENEITNMDRCEVLKQATQIDIVQAVLNNRKAKEE